MAITLAGKLSIKAINGSRGTFSVGDLVTEIGNFRVKDALLDEFDPGSYQGQFVIGSIYPASYTWRGKVSIEVRAKIIEMFLDGFEHEQTHTPLPSDELDPIDEEIEAKPQQHPEKSVPIQTAKAQGAPETVGCAKAPQQFEKQPIFNAELQAIIDDGGPVKLDPTVDRALFRQQRDVLKAMGFRFDASAQHWIKS